MASTNAKDKNVDDFIYGVGEVPSDDQNVIDWIKDCRSLVKFVEIMS